MRGSLRPSQLAFARDALMLLGSTLDTILELSPIVRELHAYSVTA
jgi:hypothetical protein